MGHTVTVDRRTDGTFAPILEGGMVAPGEAIRLIAEGVNQQFIHAPDFRIVKGLTGEEVFARKVTAGFDGRAFVDTVAPREEGSYKVIVHAQTAPFLPFTHEAQTLFAVSTRAPPPPPPPPATGLPGVLGQIRGLGIIAVTLVGLVVVSQFVRR